MSVETTPATTNADLGDVRYAVSGASTEHVVDTTAATSTWAKLTSLMGQAVLPVTAAAAIASLRTPIYRRIFSVGLASGSQVRPIVWATSDFMYTEAYVTRQEIEALNRLLSLDLAEGITLDLPEA